MCPTGVDEIVIKQYWLIVANIFMLFTLGTLLWAFLTLRFRRAPVEKRN